MERLTIPGFNIASLNRDAACNRAAAAAREKRDTMTHDEILAVCHGFFARNGKRRTKDEIACLDAMIMFISEKYDRFTVRQIYYQAASIYGIVPKTDNGYDRIADRSVMLRRGRAIPFWKFSDNTRWMMKPETWDTKEEMLRHAADGFRMNLWRGHNQRCEIWLEKDALAGVIADTTEKYDVPLMVSRGFSSVTFLEDMGRQIREHKQRGVKTTIFLMYDFDASGQIAARKIGEGLQEFSGCDLDVFLLGVTEKQIQDWDLPTRPPKEADRKKKWPHDFCCELDAIDPNRLGQLVTEAISSVADFDRMNALRAEEAAAKEALQNWPIFDA
jgi:hypothetical protein